MGCVFDTVKMRPNSRMYQM